MLPPKPSQLTWILRWGMLPVSSWDDTEVLWPVRTSQKFLRAPLHNLAVSQLAYLEKRRLSSPPFEALLVSSLSFLLVTVFALSSEAWTIVRTRVALTAAQPSAQKERKSLRLECLLPFSLSCPDPVFSPSPRPNSSQHRESGLWEHCVCFNRESMAGLEQANRTEPARKLSPPGLMNSFLGNRSTC